MWVGAESILDPPFCIVEVLLYSRMYYKLEDVVSVHVHVDFDPLFYENNRVMTLARIPSHHMMNC